MLKYPCKTCKYDFECAGPCLTLVKFCKKYLQEGGPFVDEAGTKYHVTRHSDGTMVVEKFNEKFNLWFTEKVID